MSYQFFTAYKGELIQFLKDNFASQVAVLQIKKQSQTSCKSAFLRTTLAGVIPGRTNIRLPFSHVMTGSGCVAHPSPTRSRDGKNGVISNLPVIQELPTFGEWRMQTWPVIAARQLVAPVPALAARHFLTACFPVMASLPLEER